MNSAEVMISPETLQHDSIAVLSGKCNAVWFAFLLPEGLIYCICGVLPIFFWWLYKGIWAGWIRWRLRERDCFMADQYDIEVEVVNKNVPIGCTIVDVGSNAGYFATEFLDLGYTVISIGR
jgi:hypothetical protein